MRLSRIYSNQELHSGTKISLEKPASQHLLKVLRLKPGTQLRLFNGHGGEYDAVLVGESGKQAQVRIGDFYNLDVESPLQIQLAISISRGDRMDWVMQKATELGVSSIQPLFSERTEVRLAGDRLKKKQQHWQQIVISACEQSGRNTVPQVHFGAKLNDWQPEENDLKFILHHHAEKPLQANQHASIKKLCLLIGPEGGFSELEVEQALVEGFQPLTLGPRVLRTETAPLAAISILQSIWGDIR